MHTCCDDSPLADRLWHGAYRRWYDADRAGRPTARAWGWIADRLVRFV